MKKISLKNLLINICLVAVSVIVCLLAIEGLTRILFKSGYTDGAAFRRSNPPPYRHSPYYSKEFLAASAKPDGGLSNPKGTRILYPIDSKGVFYNVVNNRRYTTDQPEKYKHTIYIYGGSTVYNGEVPDKYTIASFLQRMYNVSDPETYRVVNCGVSSINTMQQLEKLKSTKLLAGDKVIFYGGVNDALLFTTGKINGWIMGENDKEYEHFSFVQRIKFKLYMKFHDKSLFITKFLYPFSDALPPHMTDPAKIKALQDQLYASYMHSIKEADKFCQENQVDFYNFLQPNILTRKPNTAYEKELLKNKYLISAQTIASQRLSYQALQKATESLKVAGIKSKDVTSILDSSKDEHFLDYCHVTDKANNIIASEIYASLKNN